MEEERQRRREEEKRQFDRQVKQLQEREAVQKREEARRVEAQRRNRDSRAQELSQRTHGRGNRPVQRQANYGQLGQSQSSTETSRDAAAACDRAESGWQASHDKTTSQALFGGELVPQRIARRPNHNSQVKPQSPFDIEQVPQRKGLDPRSDGSRKVSQATSGREAQAAQSRTTHERRRTSGQPVTRQQMPSFGVTDQLQEAATGWGWGSAQIAPVQHKTDEEIEAEKAAEAEEKKKGKLQEQKEKREAAERRKNEKAERQRELERERRAANEQHQQRMSNRPLPPPPPPPPEARTSINQEDVSSAFSRTQRNPQMGARASFDAQGEYRATPFRPSDYRPSSGPTIDYGSPNTWHHLTPRKEEPALVSHPRPAQEAFNGPNKPPLTDDATIEQRFQEHKRQRDKPAPSFPWNNPNITETSPTSRPVDAVPRTDRQCARCMEFGHHARECKNPMVCRRCGEAGHQGRYCRKSWAEAQRTMSRRNGTESAKPDNLFRKTQSADVEEMTDSTTTFSQSARQRPRGHRQSSAQASAPHLETHSPPRGFAAEKASHDAQEFKPAAQSIRSWKAAEDEAEEDPAEDRRSRRSRRGFVDEETENVAKPKAPERQKDWRASRRRESDEDADDEALAAREERAARKAAKKAQEKADLEKRKAARAAGERAGGGTQVHLPEFISVSNLAQHLEVGYEPFVQRLEQLGYDDIFPGKILNRETSGMIAMEYDFDPVYEGGGSSAKSEEEERDLRAAPDVEDTTFLPTRPPVVTVMGHVDHGKTTILDYLRRTSVAAGEAGGITQHIGAFSVPLTSSGRTITFLDTPGHAAFMSMRQRGANVTDIVILVVAADDSVKPQTLESIRCAREADVPMIVAVNKVDKPEADVQRVKNDLSRHGVEIEDFGGEVQVVEVSGKTGQGLDALEENVVTLSEILDHRSDTDGAVEGWVLEATTKRAGRVATVLVRRGTLRPGAVLVAGNTWARVRTLRDERDQNVMEVGPGMPVEVDGWRDQPAAGDEVLQAPGEQKATDVIAYRLEKSGRVKMEEDMEAINEARRVEQDRRKAAEKAAKAAAAFSAEPGRDGALSTATPQHVAEPEQDQSTGQQSVPFIIKADVSGSAEAVAAYIPSLTSPLIAPLILASTVGAINESDVELSSASGGHIVAFNLPKNEDMRGLAESKGVLVLENNIIYRTLEQVKELLEARLPAIVTQKVVGEAEVGMVFEIGVGGRKKLRIAGCKVRNGTVGRGARVRVMRSGDKVYDGEFPARSALSGVSVADVSCRYHQQSQEREERCAGDAQGDRVRGGF